MVEAFEGNKAETKTMLPVIRSFMAAHDLRDVTVVADAGMISEANQNAIEDAGLSFILGTRIPEMPYVVNEHQAARAGSAGRPQRCGRELDPDTALLCMSWSTTSRTGTATAPVS